MRRNVAEIKKEARENEMFVAQISTQAALTALNLHQESDIDAGLPTPLPAPVVPALSAAAAPLSDDGGGNGHGRAIPPVTPKRKAKKQGGGGGCCGSRPGSG